MFRGTKDIMLPTTITGSLPRPSWYTENLGTRHFLEAMVSRGFREQYEDALTCYLRDQELAGLDIVTDGDCRFDDDVGGQSWTALPAKPHERVGRTASGADASRATAACGFPRGHILHDYLEVARHAGHHRPDRTRQSAVRRDVEGGATHAPTGRSSSAPSQPEIVAFARAGPALQRACPSASFAISRRLQ